MLNCAKMQSFNLRLHDCFAFQTGLLSGLPFVGMFLANFSGYFSDVITNSTSWSINAIRKTFNTVGKDRTTKVVG